MKKRIAFRSLSGIAVFCGSMACAFAGSAPPMQLALTCQELNVSTTNKSYNCQIDASNMIFPVSQWYWGVSKHSDTGNLPSNPSVNITGQNTVTISVVRDLAPSGAYCFPALIVSGFEGATPETSDYFARIKITGECAN